MRTYVDVELEIAREAKSATPDDARVSALQQERDALLADEAERRRTLGTNAPADANQPGSE